MVTQLSEKEVDKGNYDIDFDCGCEAECSLQDGHPVWYLLSLCQFHDPTIPLDEKDV